jgi:hypothetical protein
MNSSNSFEPRFRIPKGIVLAAGGMGYFTSVYINIRVIRERLNCPLPIEVFYAGEDEMPREALDFMHQHFSNVRFIDIQTVTGAPQISMKGYQIKVFSVILSSFKEVLFLDADNIPLSDPTQAFDLKPYKKTGALFWPDFCNMKSTRVETWDVFNLPRPISWPALPEGKPVKWSENCQNNDPIEIESGQMVFNKKKVWDALVLVAFINKNNKGFFQTLFLGDKQTFSFGFNATNTPFSVSKKHPIGIGLKGFRENGLSIFKCSSVSMLITST